MRSKTGDNLDYKDAVFISPHKFIGGPGTPGVLVVRKDLLSNRIPSVPGGGTVTFVNSFEHHYLADPEHREEGGTPAIIESIRAGLVFQLKEAVGVAQIRSREEDFIRRAIESWRKDPNIRILGNPEADRLSIVSFVIRFGQQLLHYNYVVALLNDLFGIQARGGCSCAGPYGHRLLGIDEAQSRQFEHQVELGCAVIKPGWVRVNFNYFISEEEFGFIVNAVHLIAEHGWRLLPHYRFESSSGLWRHRDGLPQPPLSLFGIDYSSGRLQADRQRQVSNAPDNLRRYLAEALSIMLGSGPVDGPADPLLEAEAEGLRWFPLPQEVQV